MPCSPDRADGGVALWAGLECTINRIGDSYRDQLDRDFTREVEAAISLGVRALRYPLLWEKHGKGEDWSVPDRHLAMLREADVQPIIGLIHHGSGPRETSLVRPDFAAGLAHFATQVARRYPWVEAWTPVNEPLTTARFSALYGLWFPHLRDEKMFWIALFNQIDAVRLAMRNIRAVNAAARLVQTEDLGKTHATVPLADQAAFDNERRWMTWDLLCGTVTSGHALWPYLVRLGFEDRLTAMAQDPCPPDIVGINHYLTSDRFLDHRLERYPQHSHGGNGRRDYADVEAIRVLVPPPAGLSGAVAEAFERYGLPMAITEVHNACSREQQMRWTAEAWQIALTLRDEGMPIIAVTPWAVTGSRDWRSLLTRKEGHVECGAFDRSGTALRPTAMVPMLKAFAQGDSHDHPALDGPGWWRTPQRLLYPEVAGFAPTLSPCKPIIPRRPVLIIGATGTLGQAICRACHVRNLDAVATIRAELDLEDQESIATALRRIRPWVVINASGWVRVDAAEDARDECFNINAAGAIRLARTCDDLGIRYVGMSSDLVFDGSSASAYCETDIANPLNVYGQSKLVAEQAIDGLMIRTAAFFSPHDPHNFAHSVLNALRRGERFSAPGGYRISPTYVPDLVDALLDLAIDGADGLWHLTNTVELSWADFAVRIAEICKLPSHLVVHSETVPSTWRAVRPPRSGLRSDKGNSMPDLTDALQRFAAQLS